MGILVFVCFEIFALRLQHYRKGKGERGYSIEIKLCSFKSENDVNVIVYAQLCRSISSGMANSSVSNG